MLRTGIIVQLFLSGCWLLTSELSAETQDALAQRYVVTAKDVRLMRAAGADVQLDDGRILLSGGAILPTTDQWEGVDWRACVAPDGHILWSARAEPQPDHASLFPLASDGNSIWQIGVRENGSFEVARFETPSLRRTASLQLKFQAIANPAPYIALQRRGYGSDVQSSMVQIVGDKIHVAVVTPDARVLFDKLYQLPPSSHSPRPLAAGDASLHRLPDGSGYYLSLRRALEPTRDSPPGLVIAKLDNSGLIKWANSYALGFPDFEAGPRLAPDGSIFICLSQHILRGTHSWLIRIGPDGVIRWARVIEGEGMSVAMTDFAGNPRAYQFVTPYFYVDAVQVLGYKTHSNVFALNYDTGEIVRQVRLEREGALGFVAKTPDSIYMSLLGAMMAKHSDVALLRFDLDLNLRAMYGVRNGLPHWAWVHPVPGNKLLFSYGYDQPKAIAVQLLNENFESTSSCGVLQPIRATCSKTNFQAQPMTVTSSPMPIIPVTDAHSEMGQAELKLVPVEVAVTSCDGTSAWSESSAGNELSPDLQKRLRQRRSRH